MSRNSPVLRDSLHSKPPLTCDGSPIRHNEMLLNDQRCSLKSTQEVINSVTLKINTCIFVFRQKVLLMFQEALQYFTFTLNNFFPLTYG